MKLSVTVISFNHAEYLKQCLESIVTQRTSFKFEVIVADDCSSDGSQRIIRKYQQKYPELIKPILQRANTYTIDKKNYSDAFNAAKGEYIAYLDGDDLMAPGKLQAQADYLDVNEDCWMVHHPLKKINKDGVLKLIKPLTSNPPKEKACLQDYLFPGFTIKHSSKMFRKSAIPEAGFCFDTDKMSLDVVWIIQSFLKSGLKVGFINQPLGYYRQFTGVSQSQHYIKKRKEGILYALKLVEKERPELKDVVSKARSKQEILEAAEKGDWLLVRDLTKNIRQYRKLNLLSWFPAVAHLVFNIKKKHLG